MKIKNIRGCNEGSKEISKKVCKECSQKLGKKESEKVARDFL